MGHVYIYPVLKFSLHQSKTRFAKLEEDLCLAARPDIRYTDTPRSLKHSMKHSSTENAAGPLHRSSILSNNSAVFHPKLTQIAGDVGYIVLLQSKFHVLPENPCFSKQPALKVGRRLGCIQTASKQNNTHMSCYTEPRLHLLLQIIPRFGPNIW